MGSPVKKKLFYQTMAFILPFVILSIAATAIVLSVTTHRFYKKTILQDYTNIINTAGNGISLFMDNARLDVESLARVMASLKLDSWEKDIALTAFLHQNPQFMNIDIVSANGGVTSSAPSSDPLADPAPVASHPDLMDRALSGQTAVSKVMKDENSLPHVDFYVPVFRLGKVDEILRAHLSLKFIWDTLEGIRIGKKGQVYVMDGSGRVIAHREIHRVFQSPCALTPETLKAIREQSGPVEWVETCDGALYNLGIYLPGLDWIVALTQPRKEVYQYLYENSFWAALISLVIAACVILRGWWGTRRLLAPIKTLHRQVMDIGRGNLDQTIAIDREDEIGDLGIAFNKMTVSLKKYLEQEIETARAMAHAKNLAALGTVASKVSHEMGNFLFGLQMMISGLKKEPLSQNGLNTLKTIENEMAQTRIFIHAYMNFAKKPALNFTRRSLDGVIREVLETLRPKADEREIGLALDWDPAIPPIRLAPVLMNQVFTNLVKNSLEAMEGGPGTLTITGKAAGEQLLVSIADTGPGMDAETLEKLFEPFFSTKGVLGNGLGLAIAKSNIEAHGGTIECVSGPGKGAEFLIRLPMES